MPKDVFAAIACLCRTPFVPNCLTSPIRSPTQFSTRFAAHLSKSSSQMAAESQLGFARLRLLSQHRDRHERHRLEGVFRVDRPTTSPKYLTKWCRS